MMLEIALFTVAIATMALLLQQKAGIPTPMSIIACVVAMSLMGHSSARITDAEFDGLIYLMLPILICSDALALRWSEIKRNAISLIYVAGIMILLSVGMAIAMNRIILPDYRLTAPAVAALFCMVLATDPVTVSSVFGRVRLPHNLKVIAEGESLFNDASALIVFSIALTYMGIGGGAGVEDPLTYSFQMIAGALLVGLVVGWCGLQAIRFIHDAQTETMIILAMALGSFAAAEHFHSSGILAVVVAIMFASSSITRRLRSSDDPSDAEGVLDAGPSLKAMLTTFDQVVKDEGDYRVLKANIQFAALIASTVLFISMANLIRLELLARYWKEILSVFVGSTVIRMAMLGIFARLSRFTKHVVTIPLHWWKVLAAAGVKGAFSILMLHMLPADFVYIELFEAVVVGNILLSTFLYPIALTVIIGMHREKFDTEYQADHAFED
jgi:CPA1 family monovalent cation:H+ antiporter